MKTNKLAKRFLAVVLAFMLVMATPLGVYANTLETSKEVEVTPLEGVSLHDNIKDINTDEAKDVVEEAHSDDEEVMLIVELEKAPLIESYINSGSAMSISDFGSSMMGQNKVNEILAEQRTVINALANVGTVKYQYTTVMNGFAIEATYGDIETIENIPGVKTVAVSGMYQLIEPMQSTANEMTYANIVNSIGLTGEGMKIAILDTGLETTHEAFQIAPNSPALSKDDVAKLLADNDFMSELYSAYYAGTSIGADDVYVSEKVPYAYDYADVDTDVSPISEETYDNVSHGTHVAGTAAGYAVENNGVEDIVTFSGVAPDAQLLIMKVFSDYGGGAYTSDILAALEDAVILGADVINMSLGSDAGFSVAADEIVNEVYNRVRDAGVNLMCAAGNAYDSAYYNSIGYNLNLATDIDTGIVSSPSTYAAAVSVASINNTYTYVEAFKAGEQYINFVPSSDKEHVLSDLIPEGETEVTLPVVHVGGVGSPEDIAAAGDLTGKIALIQRGELSFEEKNNNAAAAGAVATIIYDNVTGNRINMQITSATIPAVYVSLADGNAILALEVMEITIYSDLVFLENPTAWEMSDFSSLGVSSDLTLKPEITAPGGSIYSAYPGNTYETMSGTSMATPHMAGAAAVIRQYVKEIYGDTISNSMVQEIVNNILISTAQPVVEGSSYYSPRKQGAGIVNLAAAVLTPAFLSIDVNEAGNTRPIFNLGDDPAKTGEFTGSFYVNNMSNEELTYSANAYVQVSQPASDGYDYYITSSDILIDIQNIGLITVPAGESVKVDYTITVPEDWRPDLEYIYPNGVYVEGFVVLTDPTRTNVTLSAPFLGFYGDWAEAPMHDSAAWWEDEATLEKPITMTAHGAYSTIPGYPDSVFPLGLDLFGTEVYYDPANFTISPNGDGWYDELAAVWTSQLRNSETVTYEITDEAGNVVYEYVSEKNPKTVFNLSYQQIIPAAMYTNYAAPEFYGTDLEGNPLADGTKLTVSVTSDLGYEGRESGKDTWSFPLSVDLTAPELKGMTARISEIDGSTYLQFTAVDNVALMHVTIVPVAYFGSYEYVDYYNTVDMSLYGGTEKDVSIDISAITSNSMYSAAYIFLDDYGYNEIGYSVPLSTEEGLTISAESYLINVDEQLPLSAINNTDSETVVVSWTSDNEAVATINENGVVTGVAPGLALVTASTADGEYVANCIIGVRDNTVESIELSVKDVTMKVGQAGNFRIERYEPFSAQIDESMLTVVSDNPEVADVAYDSAGNANYFVAYSVGTATFTVSVNGATTTFNVNVVDAYDETGVNMFLRATAEAGTGSEKHPAVQAQSIYLWGSYNFYVGYEYLEEAVALEEDVYTWTISDPTVASITGDENAVVNEDGSITANHVSLKHLKPGHTVLTATDSEGRTATYSLYIVPNKVTGVELYDTEWNELLYAAITLKSGEAFGLETYVNIYASLTTEELNSLYFESFDENIATVDEDGVITAVRPGYTVIRAWAPFGFDSWVGVYVFTDKSELEAVIDDANEINPDDYYKGNAWDNYLEALANAEAVLADPNATQEEIDAAAEALRLALRGLKPYSSETPIYGGTQPGDKPDFDYPDFGHDRPVPPSSGSSNTPAEGSDEEHNPNTGAPIL